MILKCYNIYDAKAEIYLPPFFARANGEAVRIFTNFANDKSHPIGEHPEDYTLFRIGFYDQAKGLIAGLDASEPLGKALDYVTEEASLGGYPQPS